MCDHSGTMRWTLALCGLCGTLTMGGAEKNSTQGREPARQFNSKLPFRVWALVEEGPPPMAVGNTPSEQPLAIPACIQWWMEPLNRPDAAMAREFYQQNITGLQLSYPASDDDLVDIKEMKGLATLRLSGMRLTDSGVAHLKDLTVLETLDLANTRVTDAGLAHLMGLKGLQRLLIGRTSVTDAGIAELRRALPNLKVQR